MIIQEEKLDVEKVGVRSDNKLKILANAKIWKLLTKNLYSDPIKATIRELAANAYDAHVMAGKPTEPFLVHLPNKLEPFFSYRDFGNGLSDQEVSDIFMTLGESTKTDSNDVIGAFGVGSKAVYGYTENFTIKIYRDGKRSIYACYVDEDGLPTMPKQSETDSDEPSGFEIIIPVKEVDFSKFETNAKEILSHFRPLPIVNGNSSFSFLKREAIVEEETFKVYKQYGGKSIVVMGNIAYPIDASALGYNYYNSSAPAKLLANGLEIRCNIGEVSIAASREALQYDSKTITFVTSKLLEIEEKVKEIIDKEFASCKTKLEVRKKIANFSVNHEMSRLYNLESYEFNNETIRATIFKSHLREKFGDEAKDMNISKLGYTYMKLKKTLVDSITIRPGQRQKFLMVDNLSYGGMSRIREYLRENPGDIFLVENAPLVKWFTDEGIDVKEDVIFTSELPVPPRKERDAYSKDKSLLYKFTHKQYSTRKSDNWEAIEKDLEDGGVYVVLDRFSTKIGDDDISLDRLQGYMYCIENLLGYPTVLYGVRKADEETLLTEGGDWLSLQDFIEKSIKGKAAVIAQINATKYRNQTNLSELIVKFEPDIHQLQQNNPIRNYIETFKRLTSKKDSFPLGIVNAFHSLNNRFQVLKLKEINQDKLARISSKIYEKFPMLGYLSYVHYDDALKYVLMVERLSQLEKTQNCQINQSSP